MPARRLVSVCSLVGAVSLSVAGAAVSLTAAGVAVSLAAPAPAGAQTITLPGATTTTSTTVAPTTSTTRPAVTTTTRPAAASRPHATTATTQPAKSAKSGSGGVPGVPVGGPPTTTAPAGAKPAPMPDPTPILLQVDSDLEQLQAISDVKLAEDYVSKAQTRVTGAGAALLSARQDLATAQAAQAKAESAKADAAGHLRRLAIDAYVGVGYTTPGIDPTGGALGSQATPAGLSGVDAADAQEMLILVGQHARQSVDAAAHAVTAAAKTTKTAEAVYQKQEVAVSAAEAQLLAARQTLNVITTAATTPGAAAATPVSELLAAEKSGRALTPADLPTATTTAPGVVPAADQLADPVTNPSAASTGHATSPAILGPSELNVFQLAEWWQSLDRKPNLTVPIDDLIASYAKWGTKLDVDYAVAFAQSIVETGSFSFPSYGQLTDKDNNFAGIGACDSCAHGWSFPTADAGVLAQLELLHEYATTSPLPKGIPNAIGGSGIGGCCATWTQLAGKWASSTVYGISIMTVYHQMLTWLIPQEEMSAGLIAQSQPASAQGPELAPLPKGIQKPKSTTSTTAAAPGPKKGKG